MSKTPFEEGLRKASVLVGWTPLRCFRTVGLELCVKIEYGNPTGSHKDRIALNMLRAAVREGLLRPGDCVAEISSGNTAAAVAWAARLLGLRPVLFVEKQASRIKKLVIESMGGEIVEIGDEGLTRDEAVEKAREMGCFLVDQMRNPYNHLAHYNYTALEILRQADWRIDAFIMGMGTAGTVTGVGRRLHEELGNTLVAAVVPRGSPLDPAASSADRVHRIEGLVSYSVPPLYERYGSSSVDTIVAVTEEEAISGIVGLLEATGIAAGPSTGAAFAAVKRLLEEGRLEQGSRVVIVAADSLTRYPEVMELLAGRRGLIQP